MKVGAIIQARTNATRLPGKVLLPLPYGSSRTVLEQIIFRLQHVSNIEPIVATSKKIVDDVIAKETKRLKIACFRGSETNVLSRFYQAAKEHQLENIIRIPADTPCLDTNLLAATLSHHLNHQPDYTATKDYPLGINIEIMSFTALETTYHQVSSSFDREHVTAFIYRHPKKFHLNILPAPQALHYPAMRLTLDTPADYALLCAVYGELYPKETLFDLHDIVKLFKSKPYLHLINSHIPQKADSTKYL